MDQIKRTKTSEKNENLKHFEILIQKYTIWNTVLHYTYILKGVEFTVRNTLGRLTGILSVGPSPLCCIGSQM
jgi:hypothetical protein